MPPAVTLAMPESSVAVTVTVIDPSGRVTSGLSSTEVISGGVMSPGSTRVMSYTKLSAAISSWVITYSVTLD